MKLETVKSATLAILIGISLLLTLGLWTYQPNYNFLTDSYAEADIGGKDDIRKKDLVTPSSFTFHQYDRVYGFTDPEQGRDLYYDMQEWQMDNLTEKSANGPPTDNSQVELIFPDRLPMELADSLFSFPDNTDFPNWSFQRIFITFNQGSLLEVEFLSTDGNKSAKAVINNENQYDRLRDYVTKQDDLSEYTKLETADLPIYIPKNKPEMKERKLMKKRIDPGELIDALFSDPETVRRDPTNADEVYYTDGFRGMRVKGGDKSVKYFNPLHEDDEDNEQMDPVDLLDISHDKINEERGWTGPGEHSLDTLDPSNDLIRYRMYYAGYPMFNDDYAVIEQEWHDEDLYKYERPIVRFNIQPGESTVELESGDDVLDYIKETSKYDKEDVEDIKLGYHVTEDESENETSLYLTMEPAWYLKYHGSWQELDLDDTDQDEGGS